MTFGEPEIASIFYAVFLCPYFCDCEFFRRRHLSSTRRLINGLGLWGIDIPDCSSLIVESCERTLPEKRKANAKVALTDIRLEEN